MEETEIPTEGLHEELHHHAEHAGPKDRWIAWVALSSAIFAALAAVASLLSGHHANEAMLEQLKASDHWSQYQAKSIKSSILRSRMSILGALGKPAAAADEEKAKEYEVQQAEVSKEARDEEAKSAAHLGNHQVYARSVTFAQIAIALGAVSVLSRRKRFGWVALSAGLIGAGFLIQGLLF